MKPEESPRGIPDGEFHEIHLAARDRDASGVARLLQTGVDADLKAAVLPNGDGGNTPIWFAAQGARPGGKDVAKVLIAAGADVNAIGEHGTTAAHLACSWGHADVLEFLWQNRADLTIRDDEGMTAETTARKGYAWQLTKVTDEQRAGVIDFFDRLQPDQT